MLTLVHTALVVESSYQTRKAIEDELFESGIAASSREANSLSEALEVLAREEIGACLLGVTLSQQAAVRFLDQAMRVVHSPDCAFIALTSPNGANTQALIDAGADSTIEYPFRPATIVEKFEKAVKSARVRAAVGNAFNAQQEAETRLAAENILLRTRVSFVAGEMRELADAVSSGILPMSPDGRPSGAIDRAIRLVAEQALLPSEEAKTLGTFDHYFVDSVVKWFSDRVNLPAGHATEKLRQRLVKFQQELTPSRH